MRRLLTPVLTVLLFAMYVVPVMAQNGDAATSGGDDGGGGVVSFFRAFFLPEGSDLVGLAIIWLLLLLSALSMGFAIKLIFDYRRGTIIPDDTAAQVEAMLSEKQFREAIDYAESDPSYLGKLCSAALSEASNGFSAMERAIEEAGDAETSRILRPVEYLNVLGNIAPMMGLFGTVYGMILAFQKLVATGGAADPAELAGGISTALVTTFWGLVVAIPALASYSLIRNKIDALTSEGMLVAEDLITPFKPGKKSSSSSPSSSSRPRATPKPDAEPAG